MSLLDAGFREKVEKWLSPTFDEETRTEIQGLLDAGDEAELHERFYRDLEFGTGGLRGIMGAGLNRMNRYTVARATQGLANYIRKTNPPGKPASVAIAFDSRIHADTFSQEAACVLAGNGIGVFLFDALRPTPELSFAVRVLGATAGIVVTASHNPKEYNGYKVYWSDGGQIVPPHDIGIIDEVRAITDFAAIKRLGYEEAVEKGLIQIIGEKIDNAYYEAILPLSIKPHVCREASEKLKIVYTPLHGSGITLVPSALARWGFAQVLLCEEQATPDGEFPAAPFPNPEEPEALAAAIRTAENAGADLVLATDPDADRVGIAVRHEGEFRLLSGNQVASMLVDYVLGSHAERGSLLPDAAVVKTIVTTELIAAITEHYQCRLENTLTGFKYIGEKIREFQESGEAQYMVGGEESYGYLVGTHARDKDAVVSCCFIAEMAADSLARGETLVDRIDGLFCRFGVFQESLASLKLSGSEGQERIAGIMASFRGAPPEEINGVALVEVRDYLEDEVRDVATGKVTGTTGLPRSNVLVFRLADGSQIVARPSGTEPKIKFYFGMRDTEALPIPAADLDSRKTALATRHDAMREAFLSRAQAIAED